MKTNVIGKVFIELVLKNSQIVSSIFELRNKIEAEIISHKNLMTKDFLWK